MERVGQYEVLASLGRGGMARVDLARSLGDAGFVRLVALKRLHATLSDSPSMVARFYDEAALAARIRHANVVSVIDVLVHDGKLAIAYELVVGIPLRNLLRHAGPAGIPTPIATRIAIDVLEGLHAAHTTSDEHGAPLSIVHRDISSANVLVDESGVSQVTDFGLAKARKRLAETAPGDLHGTVSFMAPERIRGEAVDARCDVWAAAVLLWEMLSGKKLFAGPDGELVWRILEGVIQPAGSGRTDVSSELASVVARGLSRDLSRRFETTREMALAIERVASPAPPRVVADWLEYRMGAELEEQRARARAARRGEYCAEAAPSTIDPCVTQSVVTKPAPVSDEFVEPTLRDVASDAASLVPDAAPLGRTLPTEPPRAPGTPALPPAPTLRGPPAPLRGVNRTAPLVSKPPAIGQSARDSSRGASQEPRFVVKRVHGSLLWLVIGVSFFAGAMLTFVLVARRGRAEARSVDADSTPTEAASAQSTATELPPTASEGRPSPPLPIELTAASSSPKPQSAPAPKPRVPKNRPRR